MSRTILLIGLGRFGRSMAFKLNELNQQVMAVDKDEERVNKVLSFTTNAQIGDSTNIDFLRSLGVSNFDVCIVAIGDNFLSSLETASLLKELGAKKVVARAASLTQEKFLLRNGADEVVFPEKQLAIWSAIKYSSAAISNYLELSGGYSIYEISVPKQWVGKTIEEVDIRKQYDMNILGFRKDNKTMMHVTASTVFEEDLQMLILGKNEDVAKYFHL